MQPYGMTYVCEMNRGLGHLTYAYTSTVNHRVGIHFTGGVAYAVVGYILRILYRIRYRTGGARILEGTYLEGMV